MNTTNPIDIETLDEFTATCLQNLLDGGTVSEIFDITREELEALYAGALAVYNQGRYLDALRLFNFLLLQNHLDRRFSLGAAACQQMLKNYQAAVKLYYLAWFFDATDPAPLFHAAECLLEMGHKAEARDALRIIARQGEQQRGGAALAAKAQAMADLLDQTL